MLLFLLGFLFCTNEPFKAGVQVASAVERAVEDPGRLCCFNVFTCAPKCPDCCDDCPCAEPKQPQQPYTMTAEEKAAAEKRQQEDDAAAKQLAEKQKGEPKSTPMK